MKILIDLRVLNKKTPPGVQVFTKEITKNLIQLEQDHQFFLWTNGEPVDLRFLVENQKNPNSEILTNKHFSVQKLGLATEAYHLHTNLSLSWLEFNMASLRRPKIDQMVNGIFRKIDAFTLEERVRRVFVPYLSPAPVSVMAKKYFFIHDLAFLHFKKTANWRSRLWGKLVSPVKEIAESSHLFAPSEFTKNDLISNFKVPAAKIAVTYEGASDLFKPITAEQKAIFTNKHNLPGRFLVAFGSEDPRKNLTLLIEAFEAFNYQYPDNDLYLVIIGNRLEESLVKLKLPQGKKIIYQGLVSEIAKSEIVAAAEALVFPSLFEGFGLPVLEALKSGTPVIASNFASIPEICRDVSILFDPTSKQRLAEAIEKIYFDPKLRQLLAKKGLNRAKDFSWQSAAEVILETMLD